jgi:hypothetical protein
MLASRPEGEALTLGTDQAPPAAVPTEDGDEEGEGEAPAAEASQVSQVPQAPQGDDPVVDRLLAWLEPFETARQAPAVADRFLRVLKARREGGHATLKGWRLAFRLVPEDGKGALAGDLEAAWFRGDVPAPDLGPLCGILAVVMPAEAPRWLARWSPAWIWEPVRERAKVLAALRTPEAAARLLFEARTRMGEAWPEAKAFDLWRALGAPLPLQAPAPWREALACWKGRGEGLDVHLAAHPLDVLAARSALQTAAPGDPQAMARAVLALGSQGDERTLLDLRAMRSLLPVSWRAAQEALGRTDPEGVLGILVRRRLKTADINAALADLARLGARSGHGPASALALLEERRAPNLKALRAELPPAPSPPLTYRMVDGRPASIRPRDLTWTLLAQVLKTEGVS